MSQACFFSLLTPRPLRLSDAVAAVRDLVGPSRAEPANRSYEVRRVLGEPARLAVLERYDSSLGFDDHWRQPHMTRFLASAEELLACPPEILRLVELKECASDDHA